MPRLRRIDFDRYCMFPVNSVCQIGSFPMRKHFFLCLVFDVRKNGGKNVWWFCKYSKNNYTLVCAKYFCFGRCHKFFEEVSLREGNNQPKKKKALARDCHYILWSNISFTTSLNLQISSIKLYKKGIQLFLFIVWDFTILLHLIRNSYKFAH